MKDNHTTYVIRQTNYGTDGEHVTCIQFTDSIAIFDRSVEEVRW